MVYNIYTGKDCGVWVCRTAVGIRGKDGVVFGVEKLITSKLYEKGANKRIIHIDKRIGMVLALMHCTSPNVLYWP